jgi:hypothetical protein
MDKLCEKTGKRCFSSADEARRGMKRLSARIRIYKCPECKYYHYTKQAEGKIDK